MNITHGLSRIACSNRNLRSGGLRPAPFHSTEAVKLFSSHHKELFEQLREIKWFRGIDLNSQCVSVKSGEKYVFKTESDRVDLAKLMARINGGLLSQHIPKYKIRDQKSLLEIFSIALRSESETTLEFQHNYSIVDREALNSVINRWKQEQGV